MEYHTISSLPQLLRLLDQRPSIHREYVEVMHFQEKHELQPALLSQVIIH